MRIGKRCHMGGKVVSFQRATSAASGQVSIGVVRNVRARCGNVGRRLVARVLHAVQPRAVM